MKSLNFDPAKIIGWSCMEDGKIVSFGKIQCGDSFTLPQRLNYYHLEISRLIDMYKPDYIAIEDVILAISGARVLVFLARINGVIIQAAYKNVKDNVRIYDPNVWKVNSIPNIDTKVPKWKIQLEVCRHFNIDVNLDYKKFDALISEKEKLVVAKNDQTKQFRVDINKLKAEIARKRNPLTLDQKIINANKIKSLEDAQAMSKIELKKLKKDVEKELSTIGNDIYCQTGVSSDIADSICIGVCLHNELAT